MVHEIDSIKAELKKTRAKVKSLNTRKKQIEGEISAYLKATDQPGVKHRGVAIYMERKEGRASKKNKQRDVDAVSVLERHGIQDPEKVFKEMMEARKGELEDQEKLKIEKYKTGNY